MIFTLTLDIDAKNMEEAKRLVLGNIPGITADSIKSIGGRIPPFRTDANGFVIEDIVTDATEDPTELALKQRMERMCNTHKR